jgi:hypothetical protein
VLQALAAGLDSKQIAQRLYRRPCKRADPTCKEFWTRRRLSCGNNRDVVLALFVVGAARGSSPMMPLRPRNAIFERIAEEVGEHLLQPQGVHPGPQDRRGLDDAGIQRGTFNLPNVHEITPLDVVKAACRGYGVGKVPVSYRRLGRSKISGTPRGNALAAYDIIGTALCYTRTGGARHLPSHMRTTSRARLPPWHKSTTDLFQARLPP